MKVTGTRAPAPEPEPSNLSRRDRLALRRKHARRSRWEWVAVIVGAAIIALLLRTFFVQTFYIPSASMEPTLVEHDRVIVNKLSYNLHDVHRGDIVVFTTPPGVPKKFKDLIKRVIALPGETVEGRDGRVFINNVPLKEPYLRPNTITSDFGPVQVPPKSAWVMGDNRGDSEDSRYFHAIPESSIVGRAFIRAWPPTRLGLL